MRALAILLLVPGFSLGLVAGFTNLVGAPNPVSVQATDLVWSDRVFSTRADFAAWLRSKGTSYELWSERHPSAARRLEDHSREPLVSRSSAQSEAAGSSPAPRVRSGKALLIASLSLALLVAMLAVASVVRSARFLLEPSSMVRGIRSLRPPAPALIGVAFRPRERARVHAKAHAPRKAMPVSLGDAVDLHWREGWSRLGRLGRVTADWTAEAASRNSHLRRRYLPRVTFYAAALGLSFAVGASVAIYLN
jgi:hypothetical protein